MLDLKISLQFLNLPIYLFQQAASYEEFKKRRGNNDGNRLSSKDYNEVFNDIVAKDFKARGYYDDKYWSQVQAFQGLPFVNQTEEERMYQEKVNEIDNKMESVSGLMKHWLTFMSKKYPEDLTPEMREALQNEVSLHSTMAPSLSRIRAYF